MRARVFYAGDVTPITSRFLPGNYIEDVMPRFAPWRFFHRQTSNDYLF
jgi:hypothetical protein